MSFLLVPYLPKLVAIVAYFFTYYFCYFLIFINNRGNQHKMLKSDQLQPGGCKLFFMFFFMCIVVYVYSSILYVVYMYYIGHSSVYSSMCTSIVAQ